MSKYNLLLILLFAGFASIYAQKDTLTIEKCVDLALKNNPQIKLAESNYELSAANLTSTGSILFPQVSLNSGWTRNGGGYFVGPTAREATYESYTAGFQLQQMVFDFGKTYFKVSGTSDIKSSSEQDLFTAKQNLILNTYVAYFTYLQAIRIKEVSLESLRQAEEHLKQAEIFFKVGKKPQFDVLKAKTDEANAKVTLITSENNIIVSRLQLENILNTKFGANVILKDNLDITKDTIGVQNALSTAWSNRPELLSVKFRLDANKSFLNSAWTANLPTVNLTGGYNWRSFSLSETFLSSWNLGLTVSLPIFQGFALNAGIDQARANLKNAEAQYDLTIQTITLDVQQQYSNVSQAMAKTDATRFLLDQASETLKLAEARYKQEIGSPIEITDARVTLLSSQILYIQALYDYQVAYVRLLKAVGTLK